MCVMNLMKLLTPADGNSAMSRFSSGISGSDGSTWEADTVDWEFESDETDPNIIFS